MEDRRIFPWIIVSVFLAVALAVCGCNGENGTDPDGGDGDDGDAGIICEAECCSFRDCADNQDCVNGCCQRARVCANDTTCQPKGVCVDRRCVTLCSVDTDCCEPDHCIHGFCEPYPQDVIQALTAPPPDEGWTEKQPLKVGIGDVPLDFPVGVSMAGYGARLGEKTPYRLTLGGSDSMYDRPRVKAFAFDNGLKRIIIVKVPICYTNDFTVAHTAWRVFQATGENYIERMIFSAPHSHSHPARFWNLLPGKNMGVLAYGDYSDEIFKRITKSTAEAVVAAIDDLQPARFGYTFINPLDPNERIHKYRRHAWPIEYDDVMVVMRIDDAEGRPRAVLINLGMHGTHLYEEICISQDAPGGVEVIAQEKMQELYALPVKVAFLARNTGDSKPAGDEWDTDDWRRIQELGLRTWEKVKESIEQLEGQTTADVDLDIANRRVPVSHAALGYAEDEFYDILGSRPCESDLDCSSGYSCVDGTCNIPCESNSDCTAGYSCIKGLCGTLYYFGGFQCVAEDADEDPETVHEDGKLYCIFTVAMLNDGRPVPQFSKSRLSVMRIGDLGLITLPGEPTSDYSRDLAQVMIDEGFEYASILGLSQSHHLYLLYEGNWWQGDYEPSMSIWGWREGPYYWEKSAEMIRQFADSGGYTDNAGLKPTWFDFSCQSDSECPLDPFHNPMVCHPEGYCAVAATPTSDPGAIYTDAPATVERLDVVRLIYSGGHPGVDLPRLVLQQEIGGEWTEATNAAGEVLSDDGFNTMLYYHGDYDTDHTWEVAWDEAIDFPTGRYRLRVDGHYFDGSATQAYTVHSAAFDYLGCTNLIIRGLEFTSDRVAGHTLYPPAKTNDDGSSDFEVLRALNYKHHTLVVPPYLPWPLPADGSATVDITIQPPSGDPVELSAVPVDSSGEIDYTYVSARDKGVDNIVTRTIPTAAFDTSHAAYSGPGTYSVTVTVKDGLGNTGSVVIDFDLQ